MKQFTTFAWIFVVGLLVFAGLVLSDNIRLKERFQVTAAPSTATAPVSAAVPTAGNMVLSDSTGNLTSLPFPRGMIVIWSGAVSSIPSGWALCDGNNGTPDLRGRFVLGPNTAAITGTTPISARAVGAVGGSETVALTVGQMPRHRHSNIPVIGQLGAGTAWTWSGSNWSTDNRGFSGFTGGTAPTPDAEGPGQPHDNMPPFLVLAYIMKL